MSIKGVTSQFQNVYRGYTISEENGKFVAKRFYKNGITLKHKMSASSKPDLYVKIDDVFAKGSY